MDRLKVTACAKINLSLSVIGKRNDGYHELDTVMQSVDLSDTVYIEKSAEMIGGKYVYSRKPNPANVAINVDPDQIRMEITDTVKVCQKYGCPLDITLKDISTVSYKPQNLIIWAQTVSDVLDEYYGEA